MEHVVLVTFEDPSDSYEAFVNLKDQPDTDGYKIEDMALVTKKDNGRIETKDSYSANPTDSHSTGKGTGIGAAIGLLGGPLGVVIGGAAGGLIGKHHKDDTKDKVKALMDRMATELDTDQTGIVAIVDEHFRDTFEQRFQDQGAKVTSWDVEKL